MRRLYEYVAGYSEFSFPEKERARLLSYLLAEGIGCRMISADRGVGRLLLLRRDARRLPPMLGCSFLKEGGLPAQLSSLVHRPGILVGCLLGCLLLLLSSLTVWRVEVKGEGVDAARIEAALETAGLTVGDLKPRLDTAAVKTRFLRDNPEISWIGIYLRGTTAVVEVRRAADADEPIKPPAALLNLVAGCDGIVERVQVAGGRAVVKNGETVRAGDLLISGIYQTADGLKLTEARGEVIARITREVRVLVPLTVTEKEYTEERTRALTCNFFQKEIKLFDFAGKSRQEYDIIKKEEPLVLFNTLRLPISFTRTLHRCFTYRTRALGEEEAVRIAYSKMEGELSGILGGGTVLRKSMVGEFTEDGYLLVCQLEYLADIATPLAYGKE